MYMVRIEHPIPEYDSWKRAFDSDLVGGEQSGVRRYQIVRPLATPHVVMIDLEFDTLDQAQIVEVVETRAY